MKLDQIPKFWRNNTPANSYTNNFSTDGYNLYSYKLIIGTTNSKGKKILYNYTRKANNFTSAATSRHVNLSTFYSDSLLTPNK